MDAAGKDGTMKAVFKNKPNTRAKSRILYDIKNIEKITETEEHPTEGGEEKIPDDTASDSSLTSS